VKIDEALQNVDAAPPPKVFVSHSHSDDTFTNRLVDDLRQAGATVWMDNTDLGAGNFQQRISEALADCDWFVLVLTRAALASQWVRQEVDAANRLKHYGQMRDLIFIQAEPLEQRELPPLWGVFNIFDATTDYAAALNRALKAVGVAEHGVSAFRIKAATGAVFSLPVKTGIALICRTCGSSYGMILGQSNPCPRCGTVN
jgi:hypothetical protein